MKGERIEKNIGKEKIIKEKIGGDRIWKLQGVRKWKIKKMRENKKN